MQTRLPFQSSSSSSEEVDIIFFPRTTDMSERSQAGMVCPVTDDVLLQPDMQVHGRFYVRNSTMAQLTLEHTRQSCLPMTTEPGVCDQLSIAGLSTLGSGDFLVWYRGNGTTEITTRVLHGKDSFPQQLQ
jgi:hypothetical protein